MGQEFETATQSLPAQSTYFGVNYLQMDQLKFVLSGFRVEHRELVLAMCYLMTSKAESGAWDNRIARQQ